MRVEDGLNHSSDGLDVHGFGVGVSVPLECREESEAYGSALCAEIDVGTGEREEMEEIEGEVEGGRRAEPTSRRCLIRLTRVFPSAANPLTAITQVSVLEEDKDEEESQFRGREDSGTRRRREVMRSR